MAGPRSSSITGALPAPSLPSHNYHIAIIKLSSITSFVFKHHGLQQTSTYNSFETSLSHSTYQHDRLSFASRRIYIHFGEKERHCNNFHQNYPHVDADAQCSRYQ
jgi:hypothetical protein